MADGFIFWNSADQIVPHRLFEFFSANGIGKYFFDETNNKNTEPVIVKTNGNIVSPVNVGYLLEVTKNHILSCTSDKSEQGRILDSLHVKTSLFGDKNLKLLKRLNLNFISDSADTGYLFFENGIVEVTSLDCQLKPYSDFEDYVWEKSIIPFTFTLEDETILREKSEFIVFQNDLSVVADYKKSKARSVSLETAIGYLLHRFKDPATTKAIILMDTFFNGLPNGGTGKTLLISALGKIRKLAIIDGKMYDNREWFAYSSVDLESEILLFDDVDAKFDFEKIFPLMTTGMQIRRKHRDHVYLPFEKSPKVALTTNYGVMGESSSHRRRKFEFEVTATYSAEYTPRDKFGRNFFDGWAVEDWNLFYNTMIHCLQVFLINGLVESEPINLKLTKLINRTCEEFVDWAEVAIQPDNQYNKKRLYDNFIKTYPEYKNAVRQRDFTLWLRAWGLYKNYQTIESHSGDERNIKYAGSTPESEMTIISE